MSDVLVKVCCVCHKDVSTARRVKDAKGHYYCAACHTAALQRQPVGAAATSGAPSAPSNPPDDDLVPLADTPRSARPAPRPAADDAAPAPARSKLPEFCPACGVKVLPNRRLCVKCNRDVTQLEGLAALRAQQAAEPQGAEQFATWFGRVARVGLWVFVALVIVVVLWGVKIMFMPGGLWDNYPKTREAAVREFLQNIATGTEKSYDKAFMLVSFRERTTGGSGEDASYKAVFKRMRGDFEAKYGTDWINKIKLENLGSNDHYADDEVDFRLTMGNDTYLVATQVQIDITRATANMTLPRIKKPVYTEDGQNRFGILDIKEYLVHPKRHMVEVVGPGLPETIDIPELPRGN